MTYVTGTLGKNPNVTQLEITDPAQGGAGGVMNKQATEIQGNLASLWNCQPGGGDIVLYTNQTPPTINLATDLGKTFRLTTATTTNGDIMLPAPSALYVGGVISFENVNNPGASYWANIKCSTANRIMDNGSLRTNYILHGKESMSFVCKYDANTSTYVWVPVCPVLGGYYRNAGRIVILPDPAVSTALSLAGLVACDGSSVFDNTVPANNAYPRLFEALGVTIGSGSGSWKLPNIASFTSSGTTFKYYIAY